MVSSVDSVLVPVTSLRTLSQAILQAVGASPQVARAITDHMIDANVTGYDSHGIHLLPIYVDDALRGEIHATAEPRVEWKRGATALVSGDWGFGQYTGHVAMDVAIQLAGQFGIGLVGIVRVHHLGRMGSYSEQAAKAGMAAMSFVAGLGGAVQAAPYGGARAAYGANPFSAGFPSSEGDHLIVDYATTMLAGGKIMIARATGAQVPPGVLIDANGRSTQDPNALFDGGALLPFGAHKGYGLALFTEMMGRVLTGSDALGEAAGGGERFGRSGAIFIAIDVSAFRPAGVASEEASRTFATIRSVPPGEGFSEVLTPGQREARRRAEVADRGVELPRVTFDELAATARRAGVSEEVVAAYLSAGA